MALLALSFHGTFEGNPHENNSMHCNSLARTIVLGILVSACCHAQTASDLLSQADRFAEAGNWVSARPLYEKAEAEFHRAGDNRNELYSKFGRLHRDVEAGSYRTVGDELAHDLASPVVENDPKLKIRALALKGIIDFNVNTTAANEDWSQVLTIAKKTGDRKWENRANGELGLVAGVNGDVGTAALALFSAISTADQLGDIAAHLNFATWLGNGMAVNGMADRAMPILDRAIEIARSSSYSGVPLQLYIAKIRALTLLPEPRQKLGIDEAKKLIAKALIEAREKNVRGAQSEILIQSGQLATQEREFVNAETAFKEAADMAVAADLPRVKAEALMHLSQLYRATNEPIKAAPAIDGAIEDLQSAEEPYDLPLFVAEKAETQGALGNLQVADRLYDQATDLIEGLLVNAPSSQVKSSMIGAMSDIYVGHFRLAWGSSTTDRERSKLSRALVAALSSIRCDSPANPVADRHRQGPTRQLHVCKRRCCTRGLTQQKQEGYWHNSMKHITGSTISNIVATGRRWRFFDARQCR